jgi:hypothetical protein
VVALLTLSRIVTHYEWSLLDFFLMSVTFVDVSSHMVAISDGWSLDRDVRNRQKFCDQFREVLNDDDLQNNLIIRDEAHFHLSGYVSKQNFRYWSPDNPVKCISARFAVPRLLYGVA